jgi:uncharacterized repeat protein (TIGR01451 family)
MKSSMRLFTTVIALLVSGLLSGAIGASSDSVTTDLLKLSKNVPAKVAVGETYTVTITVTALQDVANVVVKDEVPAGAQLQGTEPQAAAAGANLTWTFPTMNAGEEQVIKVMLVAQGEGTLKCCATVSAEPRICVTTLVGKPVLAITKTGPEVAQLGEKISYSVTVSNTGTSDAKGVVITDVLPDGLQSVDGGQTMTREIGDLAADASKTVVVPVTTTKRGKFCNVASAKGTNTNEVKAEACTTVVEKMLTITKTGTERQYLGKEATYTVEITNPGDVELTNVVITDTAPANTTIVNADGGTVDGQVVTWNIGKLGAGAKASKKLTLTSRTIGNLCNNASVATAEGLKQSAQACTEWTGYPALLIEVVDTKDPLIVGEKTTYVITVTNQGTADDQNVKIVANFPAEITPISATGDTEITVAGKSATAVAMPVLKPRQTITWKVEAKAEQAGDSRMKVLLTSELLKNAVTEEESTQVY